MCTKILGLIDPVVREMLSTYTNTDTHNQTAASKYPNKSRTTGRETPEAEANANNEEMR